MLQQLKGAFVVGMSRGPQSQGMPRDVVRLLMDLLTPPSDAADAGEPHAAVREPRWSWEEDEKFIEK